MGAVTEKVTSIIIEQLSVDKESVVPEANLLDDLGADSLDVVELVMALEEQHALLEVRLSNQQARRLYRHQGFHTVGLRRRYYPDDLEDALVMSASLRLRPTTRRGHDWIGSETR